MTFCDVPMRGIAGTDYILIYWYNKWQVAKKPGCWRNCLHTSWLRVMVGVGVEGDSEPRMSIFNTEGAGPESGLRAETNGKESGTVSKQKPLKKQLLLQWVEPSRSESSMNHRDPSNICWRRGQGGGKERPSFPGWYSRSNSAARKFMFQLEPKVIANVWRKGACLH